MLRNIGDPIRKQGRSVPLDVPLCAGTRDGSDEAEPCPLKKWMPNEHRIELETHLPIHEVDARSTLSRSWSVEEWRVGVQCRKCQRPLNRFTKMFPMILIGTNFETESWVDGCKRQCTCWKHVASALRVVAVYVGRKE